MNMLEKAARAAALKLQFRDFGHADEDGDWNMTAAQIAEFEASCSEIVRVVLAAIREPDDATASRAIDIAYEAENAMSGETCPVMRNHIRSYVDAILEGESK